MVTLALPDPAANVVAAVTYLDVNRITSSHVRRSPVEPLLTDDQVMHLRKLEEGERVAAAYAVMASS
jgi:hypothetical protein